MTVAAFVVALLALLVSVLAARYTRKQAHSARVLATIESHRRAEEVSRAVMAEERARRADVDVQLAPGERNTRERLLVTNRGPAPATGVSVEFVRPLSAGMPDGAYQAIAQRRFDLYPGDTQHFLLTPDGDTAPRYEISLRWTDAAGDHERGRVIHHGG